MFDCMYIYVLNMCLCFQRPERETIGYPVTRVTGGYWESKLGTWKEQPLLLTICTISLSLKKFKLKKINLMYASVMMLICRSENNLWELVFSFHCMSSGDWSECVRPGIFTAEQSCWSLTWLFDREIISRVFIAQGLDWPSKCCMSEWRWSFTALF